MSHRLTVTLEQLLSRRSSRLPMLEALYLGLELGRRIEGRHRCGLGVGDLDVDRVLLDERAIVSLGAGARGKQDVASDVYALGKVLYEVLTGLSVGEVLASQLRTPGARLPPPSRFNPAIDPELDGVVLSTLCADPSLRPMSVSAVTTAIEAVFEELEMPVESGGLPADVAAALPDQRAATLRELPVADVVQSILAGEKLPDGVGATPAPRVTAPLPVPAAQVASAPVVAHVLVRPAPVAPSAMTLPLHGRAKPASPARTAAPRPPPKRLPPAGWYARNDESGETLELEDEPLFDESEARPPESSGAWAFAAAAFSAVAMTWALMPL